MWCKDDNVLTPLISAWPGYAAESYVVMAAAILNRAPSGTHLFCIKPFHSDNSPWAADKYKLQRLGSCTREHTGRESPCDITSTVLFAMQYTNVFLSSVCKIIRARSLTLMRFWSPLKKKKKREMHRSKI